MDVAVVGPEPEVERPEERRDEGDVGERTADEVVAALHGPVQHVMEAGHDEHGRRLLLGPDADNRLRAVDGSRDLGHGPWDIQSAGVNRSTPPADTEGVTRGMGLLLFVISLAIVGGLYAMQSKSQGPTAPQVQHDESQAYATASAQTFAQVDQVLQADYAQDGTYVGAQLPVGSQVTLAQATTTTYCLETTVNGTVVHEAGPGGSPAAGPC
jgi:hypothetical protein